MKMPLHTLTSFGRMFSIKTGLSRKGAPSVIMHDLDKRPEYAKNAKWVSTDLLSSDDSWKHQISRDCAVISCVGAFASTNEQMRRLNGDANALLCKTAKNQGALRFVYVSAYEVEKDIPIDLLPGYFGGKRLAENAVQQYYPGVDGVILQPGFVYGDRVTDGKRVIPLGWLGYPMEMLFNLPGLNQLHKLPLLGKLAFSSPVSVADVAETAVRGAEGRLAEQYVSDEVAINDDNEHNTAYFLHRKALKIDIAAIRRNARDADEGSKPRNIASSSSK